MDVEDPFYLQIDLKDFSTCNIDTTNKGVSDNLNHYNLKYLSTCFCSAFSKDFSKIQSENYIYTCVIWRIDIFAICCVLEILNFYLSLGQKCSHVVIHLQIMPVTVSFNQSNLC